MKVESNQLPQNKFELENHINNKIDVVFFDQIVENEDKTFSYFTYRITVNYMDNLEDIIKSSYNEWLEFAKNKEYEDLATQVREKRNKLLEETDKEMCIDRLNFKLPDKLSATTLLESIQSFFDTLKDLNSSKMAEYRQQLRDITKQKDFPYNVEFPEKPLSEKNNNG